MRDERGRFVAAGRDAGDAYGEALKDRVGTAGREAVRDAAGRLRDENGRFVSSGANAGRTWGDAFRENLQNVVSRNAIQALMSPITLLFKGLAFAALGAAAASATAGLIQLAAALAPVAGLALALPAAIAVGAAALGTLAVAFSG